MTGTDSAGVPWEGRSFHAHESAWGDDDGTPPPLLVEAIRRFRAQEVGEAEVADAVRAVRLLVPLVAELGADGTAFDEHGRRIDKSQELSIVTVSAPDGRAALPVFSSVAAMSAWNPGARPIPTPGPRVALAAAGEGTDLVVLDPTGDTEFALRRPALAAIASGTPWTPAYLDPEVRAEFERVAALEPDVAGVVVAPGDPLARLAGPELALFVGVRAGLDAVAVNALVARMQERWAPEIRARIDSIGVRVEADPRS
ncbi:SseB family protein [Galbitalea sp. SE-J8]|uniref:SseB family protein n=1 Tax=Galbitalea sp. SE-J8 TaxID=3054952 RepID=UPI00259C7D99|nr:SseB family protein [Galbitalea sp. SE-J8]MDM4762538.1 SseB family protein [Galbitalea sp. SE-J8]